MKKFLSSFNLINFILFGFFVVMSTIIRVIQMMFLTDFNIACDNFKTYNIFGIDFSSKGLSYCMFSMFFIYMVVLFVFFIMKKEKHFVQFYEIKNKSNIPINVSLILFFILGIVSCILFIMDLKNINFKHQSPYTIYVTLISEILFAIFFLYLAICLILDNFSKKSILNVIFIFPVLFGITRMFGSVFLSYSFLFTERELLVSVLKVVFSSMFLFCFARVLVGANSKGNEKRLILFGNFSLFFGLISQIPRTIVFFLNLNNTEMFNGKAFSYNINIFKGTNFFFFDFIILAFIAIFLFRYNFFWKKEIKD